MAQQLPFPWDLEGKNLCPALDIPAFLASAIENAPSDLISEVVKIAGPKRNPLIPRLLYDTGKRTARGIELGQYVSFVLNDPIKRGQLFRRMEKARCRLKPNELLAKLIFEECCKNQKEMYPSLDAVCKKRNDKYFLDRFKFQEWLANADLNEGMYLPIAQFASAFAILQPNDSFWIIKDLTDRDSAFCQFIANERILNLTNNADEQKKPLDEIKISIQIAPLVANTDAVIAPSINQESTEQQILSDCGIIPNGITELLQMEGNDWPHDISLKNYRYAAKLLGTIAKHESDSQIHILNLQQYFVANNQQNETTFFDIIIKNVLNQIFFLESRIESLLKERLNLGTLALGTFEQRLQCNEARLMEFDESLQRLMSQFEGISRLPWFNPPLDCKKWIEWPEDTTLHEAEQIIGTIRDDVSRILQADSILTDLYKHLNEQTLPIVPSALTQSSEIAKHLDEFVETKQRQFQQRADRERTAINFLEHLSAVGGRPSGERLIFETEVEHWACLGRLLVSTGTCTEVGGRYKALTGRFDIAGLLVAHLWEQDGIGTSELVADAFSREGGFLNRDQCRDLFAFLNFGQLQDLAIAKPIVAPIVTELIFASALLSSEPTSLLYLERLLELPTLRLHCAKLYRICLDEWRNGATVTADRLLPTAICNVDLPGKRAGELRQYLQQVIKQKPTMTQNYRRLRILAQKQFLEPLAESINREDPKRAMELWDEAGDLDNMVAECVRLLQLSGRRQKLDQTHLHQTRQYLEEFQNDLRRWSELQSELKGHSNVVFGSFISAIQNDSDSETSPDSGRLLQTIRQIRDFPNDPNLLHPDFGQRLAHRGAASPLLLNAQDILEPLMTWSWPLALRHGAVPLELVLADRLRDALGIGPETITAAVEEYWHQGDLLAAQEASKADPALQANLAPRLEKRKADLLSAHSILIDEAKGYKEEDQDIDFWFQEINRALESLELLTIPSLLQELESAVVVARSRRDPVRLSLLAFLKEAGQSPDNSADRESLQRQVEEVKVKNQERRLHILELARVRDNPSMPETLRERWTGLARSLDHPQAWPTEEVAFEVTWALQKIVTFLDGHIQDRENDPDQIDMFVQSFAAWVPQQCELDPTFSSQAGKAALQQINKIAQDIHTHRPERSIMRALGCAPPSPTLTSLSQFPGLIPKFTTSPGTTGARFREQQDETADVVRKVRSFITERMALEAAAEADPVQLKSTLRLHNWLKARELAAALARQSPSTEESWPSDIEAVFACALAYSSKFTDRHELLAVQQNACLAVLAVNNSQYRYYLPPTVLKEHDLIARAFVLATSNPLPEQAFGPALGERLPQALTRLMELAPADPDSEWVRVVFWMASKLGGDKSGLLAQYIWESLRGKENDEHRATLLRLLFRLHRGEAMRHLAGFSEPVDDLIKVCLNAFEQAEEDSSIRPQAREILMTLREQSYGKRNTRPWISLFQHLEASRCEVGEPPVTCALQSEHFCLDDNGQAIVEMLLTPSLSDPPRILSLQFLTDRPGAKSDPAPNLVVPEEEMLLRARTTQLVVPPSALVVTGDIIDLNFRLVGETILRKPIDLPVRWTFPNIYNKTARLTDDEIANAWPGASGDPVFSQYRYQTGDLVNSGFHGREDEKNRIDRYLAAPGRGRSLMIFGQRRIGKTSLLLEMVQNYPPRKGAVCGAFFDLNSLLMPEGAGEMQAAFFDFVVSKLDTEPVNEPLRRALQQSNRSDLTIQTICRGLRPKVALEDSLEGMVERLNKVSGGLISRVAFFFDEFDLFIEPLLRGRREEVLKLHGSLRQIIQRSQRIMLVLAGSGLQRLFTEDYLHPFYGSIDELEVKPFDWVTKAGRPAIEKTFLPRQFREKLTPAVRFEEVAQKASDLTGGNPYYLSMLGFAAARAWRGHPLTPALLNRVVDLLIQNKIEGGTFDVNRRKFYQPVLQSLKRLSERENAVALLMLASIARLTSTERQRWKKWKLIDDQFIEDPEVRRLTTDSERLTALNHLEKERVLEFDRARSEVRIRVPLTAAAIREDARDIHDQAIRQLRMTM